MLIELNTLLFGKSGTQVNVFSQYGTTIIYIPYEAEQLITAYNNTTEQITGRIKVEIENLKLAV